MTATIDAANVDVLLCDADGNLFPSEEPAFVASAEVTNRLLAELGIDRRFAPDELRRVAVGSNFRSTALRLAEQYGVSLDEATLERHVADERSAVIEHLGKVLRPDPAVLGPVGELARRFRLAVVSSSALARLDECFRATGLAELFPPDLRFSAEDSLEVPTSKPDPAIYAFAGEALRVSTERALAVEDAEAGVRSAVAAGFTTVGNIAYVPASEREQRRTDLLEAGARAVVESWRELAALLLPDAEPAVTA